VADKTGRVCRSVELDPLYVDVIVRRFEAATGNQAVLVETGETFEALATQGWNRRWAKGRLQLSPTSRRGTRGCYRSSARVPALRRSEVRIPSAPPRSPRKPPSVLGAHNPLWWSMEPAQLFIANPG
jgi:hypothetical protein